MAVNDNNSESPQAFAPSSDGAFSLENMVERISKARDETARLSNRFFLLSLVFAGLAAVKIAGLSLSITFLGIPADRLQYGLFFFIIAAQVCAVLSTSRTMDSRAYDFQLEKLAHIQYPRYYKEASQTIPNSHEWLTPSSETLESIPGNGFGKFFYNLAVLVTTILALVVIVGPTAMGIFYLVEHERFIVEGDKQIQYWAVFATSCLSVLWYGAYLAIHFMTENSIEGLKDGDTISRG